VLLILLISESKALRLVRLLRLWRRKTTKERPKVAEVAAPLNSKNDKQWNEIKPITENSAGMVVDGVVTRKSWNVRHVV